MEQPQDYQTRPVIALGGIDTVTFEAWQQVIYHNSIEAERALIQEAHEHQRLAGAINGWVQFIEQANAEHPDHACLLQEIAAGDTERASAIITHEENVSKNLIDVAKNLVEKGVRDTLGGFVLKGEQFDVRTPEDEKLVLDAPSPVTPEMPLIVVDDTLEEVVEPLSLVSKQFDQDELSEPYIAVAPNGLEADDPDDDLVFTFVSNPEETFVASEIVIEKTRDLTYSEAAMIDRAYSLFKDEPLFMKIFNVLNTNTGKSAEENLEQLLTYVIQTIHAIENNGEVDEENPFTKQILKLRDDKPKDYHNILNPQHVDEAEISEETDSDFDLATELYFPVLVRAIPNSSGIEAQVSTSENSNIQFINQCEKGA